MSKYLQRRFALSEQGGRDLTKAVFACAAANLGLIFPMGLLILFLEKLLTPVTGGKGVQIGLFGFIGLSILFLILIFILQYLQYNRTFLASYQESANLRIRLAEKLRKIPLSFFG